MSHTKGPWIVTHQTASDFSWDIVSNGKVVATCGSTQDKESVIACNAFLIAAAPDLLGACKTLYNELYKVCLASEGEFVITHGMKEAKNAISKAEGRSA